MSGHNWSNQELERLKKAYKDKPEWMTDMELARKLASSFKGRTVEGIRWTIRSLHKPVSSVNSAKILLLDIETLPIEALVWDTYKQNIYMEQIEKDWSVLCWSAKWLFDTKVMGQVVTQSEARSHQDASVLPKIWELMNEADMVITHNGDNFDIKRLYARFFVHGFPKPMYFKSIDTKKTASDTFGFTYNKLDWIAQILGIGRKVETEFEWWKECHNGSKKYLNMMLEYNIHDVNLEEEVYLKLRPWMDKHPNMALFNIDKSVPACPACGDLDLHWKGKYTTPLGIYKAFRCEQCGAIGRSTKKLYKLGGAIAQN